MIIDKNINPEYDQYFLGACIIEILDRKKKYEIDYFELYQELIKIKPIGIRLYALTLDWLFILGVIVSSDSGDIKKCF
jgi:hypothetical protein